MTTSSLVKRCIDVAGAGALLALTSPVLASAAAAVKVSSPGPVLFRQTRPGLHQRPFPILKLRTMRVDAEQRLARQLASDPVAAAQWARFGALEDDPRITGAVGRALRTWSIDELPQLVNVLRGEMSLVGPRPVDLSVWARLPPSVRAGRSRMRPGLTGLWQVSGRSDTDLDAMAELDLDYVSRWSLRRDLGILARTPAAVLMRRGAR